MTQLLIRLFVKNYQQADDPAVRTNYGKLAGSVGIFCNLLLALGKFAAGTVFGSIAIVADALNNLSDASSSVISLLGFKLAAKPADNDHPYGHARYEYLAGLAVAVMILVIGVELAKSSLEKILHPTPVLFSLVAVAVLAAACGADGMGAGQVLDTQGLCRNYNEVENLHRLKTGAMIRGAALLGCVAAGAGEEDRRRAARYAEHVGLAFQIRDDMLDVIADQAELGKPVGSDREEGKVTFVDLLGLDACGRLVERETELAKEAIRQTPGSGFLLRLADEMANRRK